MIIKVHVVTASNEVDVHRCAYESVEEMYAKEEETDGNTVLEYWTDESTKRSANMAEREWSIEEIIEALCQWDSAFYSDSETKWLMSKAADALSVQPDSCDGCKWSEAFGRGDCYHCKRRFCDLYTARTNE